MENLEKNFNFAFEVPKEEVVYEDLRSSGPGGQNVNKVATGQRARWNFENSEKISEEQKETLRRKISKNYLTKEGEVIVKSVSERAQNMNKKLAFKRLQEIVAEALLVPVKRKETKPTRASKEKRLQDKKVRSIKKKLRSEKF